MPGPCPFRPAGHPSAADDTPMPGLLPTPSAAPIFVPLCRIRALHKGSFQMRHSSQPNLFRSALRPAVLAAAALFSLAGQASAWDMRVCADPDRLPFSHEDMSGFENRIAEVLADELGATLSFLWSPQTPEMIANHFRTGECDLIIGVADGEANMTSTIAYYRSPFVFLYRADSGLDLHTFDDPELQDLQIAVQPTGGPTEEALVKRGLRGNIVAHFDFQLAPIVEAVADGTVDVAVLWGPVPGYLAAQHEGELVVSPVPEFEPPFIPMFINIVMGVRQGDESFRDLIDRAIAARWDEIQAILAEYDIPVMALPKPTLTLEMGQP